MTKHNNLLITQNQFYPTIKSLNDLLLSLPWVDERRRFAQNGKSFSLISPHSGEILWDPKKHITNTNPNDTIRIWDMKHNRFMLTNKLAIPHTFTLSNAISSKEMEYDLWRATALIINHHIVFPTQNGSFEKEIFDLAASMDNITNRGRFVAYRGAPDISFFTYEYGDSYSFTFNP